MNKFKEGREMNTGKATVICPWPEGNPGQEPEVGSKFPGSSHHTILLMEMIMIIN